LGQKEKCFMTKDIWQIKQNKVLIAHLE